MTRVKKRTYVLYGLRNLAVSVLCLTCSIRKKFTASASRGSYPPTNHCRKFFITDLIGYGTKNRGYKGWEASCLFTGKLPSFPPGSFLAFHREASCLSTEKLLGFPSGSFLPFHREVSCLPTGKLPFFQQGS